MLRICVLCLLGFSLLGCSLSATVYISHLYLSSKELPLEDFNLDFAIGSQPPIDPTLTCPTPVLDHIKFPTPLTPIPLENIPLIRQDGQLILIIRLLRDQIIDTNREIEAFNKQYIEMIEQINELK